MKRLAKLFAILFLGNFLLANPPKKCLPKMKVVGSSALTGMYALLGLLVGTKSLFNLLSCMDSNKRVSNGSVFFNTARSNQELIKKFISGFLVEVGFTAGLFYTAADFAKLTQKYYKKLENSDNLEAQEKLQSIIKRINSQRKRTECYNDKDTQELLTDILISGWISISMFIILFRNINTTKGYFLTDINSPKDRTVTYLFPFLAPACIHVIFNHSKLINQKLKMIIKRAKKELKEKRTQDLERKNQILDYNKLSNY